VRAQECNELRFTVAALGEQLSAADEAAERSARAASVAEQRACDAELQSTSLAADRARLEQTVSELRAELGAAVVSRDAAQAQVKAAWRDVASEAAAEVDRRKRTSGGSHTEGPPVGAAVVTDVLTQREEELAGLRLEAEALRCRNELLQRQLESAREELELRDGLVEVAKALRSAPAPFQTHPLPSPERSRVLAALAAPLNRLTAAVALPRAQCRLRRSCRQDGMESLRTGLGQEHAKYKADMQQLLARQVVHRRVPSDRPCLLMPENGSAREY
jgi:hypothetical protein